MRGQVQFIDTYITPPTLSGNSTCMWGAVGSIGSGVLASALLAYYREFVSQLLARFWYMYRPRSLLEMRSRDVGFMYALRPI